MALKIKDGDLWIARYSTQYLFTGIYLVWHKATLEWVSLRSELSNVSLKNADIFNDQLDCRGAIPSWWYLSR